LVNILSFDNMEPTETIIKYRSIYVYNNFLLELIWIDKITNVTHRLTNLWQNRERKTIKQSSQYIEQVT